MRALFPGASPPAIHVEPSGVFLTPETQDLFFRPAPACPGPVPLLSMGFPSASSRGEVAITRAYYLRTSILVAWNAPFLSYLPRQITSEPSFNSLMSTVFAPLVHFVELSK